MKRAFMQLWNRYCELILYCVFGGLTFLVDTGLFFVFSLFLPLDHNAYLMHGCSVISTLAAITFAYITNRKFVFQSKVHGFSAILIEMGSFYLARVVTMILAEVLLQITVIGAGLPARWMKLLVKLIVIALNYIFSKLWIFKKPKKQP